jgi:hypothetical protein
MWTHSHRPPSREETRGLYFLLPILCPSSLFSSLPRISPCAKSNLSSCDVVHQKDYDGLVCEYDIDGDDIYHENEIDDAYLVYDLLLLIENY